MKYNGLRTLVLVAAVVAVFAGVAPLLHASQGEATEMTMQSQADSGVVQQAIQAKFDSDINFGESNLVATVTDSTVELSGRVRDEVGHGRALDIAQRQAGERKVIDQTSIEQVYQTVR